MKKWISASKSMKNSHELKGLKSTLKASCYWSYNQQTVARGVAAGLAGAVVPGFQLFYAAILVILLRGNLPIALLFTLITNPLTFVPITYFIYFVGTLIIGNSKSNFVIQNLRWDFSSFHAFLSNVSAWILQFGKAFFIGLPIVSLCLGIIGYFGTLLIWKIYTLLTHKK
ncbi:MAG: DUF2062 domain-containing protein [Gammaproteobacteria bacterium]|nr:DUF2062 domain-containing protein [Gammaproteobacteria bacterium]